MSNCEITLQGHSHRRQGEPFWIDRDSGIPRQISAPPPVRVDLQQDQAPNRRERDGAEALDPLVLHAGTKLPFEKQARLLKRRRRAVSVPSAPGLPSPVGQRHAGRGPGVAPGRQRERPGGRPERGRARRGGAQRVAGPVVRKLLRRPLRGQARHSQQKLQSPAHEGH